MRLFSFLVYFFYLFYIRSCSTSTIRMKWWCSNTNIIIFNDVIDKKCDEWENTEYAKYLRPETLFGEKFESYVNQPNPMQYRYDNYNWDSDYVNYEESIRACEYCCAGFVCPTGTTYHSNPCAS